MTEGIIIALITGACTLLGAWVGQNKSAALIAYRLEQLEKKVAQLEQKMEARQ